MKRWMAGAVVVLIARALLAVSWIAEWRERRQMRKSGKKAPLWRAVFATRAGMEQFDV